MRCPNCGWEDNQSNEFCPKCRTSLNKYSIQDGEERSSRNTVKTSDIEEDNLWNTPPQGTIKDSSPIINNPLNNPPIDDRIKVTEDIQKTLNIFSILNEKNNIRLIPLDPGSSSKTIEFEGNNFILNRGNLDPNNPHISGGKQALIRKEGEEWIIEDQSQYGTSFLLLNRPLTLKKGDIVMLGNKRFEIDF